MCADAALSNARENQDWYHYTTAGRPRIEALTGLRWFAALAVFMSHNVPGGSSPAWLTRLFENGYMGVTIFFILSGFILTVTYSQSLVRPTWFSLRNYTVARIARIYPLYLFMLLYVVFSTTASGAPLPEHWWEHFLAIQAWSSNLGFTFALNPPGWSVGVELFLYAMFPLLIVSFRQLMRTSRGSMTVAAVGVSLTTAMWLFCEATGRNLLPIANPESAHRWLYLYPPLRLGDFILGMGLAGSFLVVRQRPRAWSGWLATGSALAIVIFMIIPGVYSTASSYDVLYAVPGAALIFSLALGPERALARILALRVVVALGEASYAFYLIHVPVGRAIMGMPLATGLTASHCALFVIGLIMLVSLSWGIHVLLERPARVWIRRGLEARSATGTVAPSSS